MKKLGNVLATEKKLELKAVANKWVSDNFNGERKYISLSIPEYQDNDTWLIPLSTKPLNGEIIGNVEINKNMNIVNHTNIDTIVDRLQGIIENQIDSSPDTKPNNKTGLLFGDGITGAGLLDDLSIDLLLTDPPYGISNAYTCEKQIPRRMRNDGSDFIMPKGDFGEWDRDIDPHNWTSKVIPKVKGWAVIFCSHIQIKDYSEILQSHKFNSVGTLVWHKTNPVPFNHKFKPINAWEAAVVGKRPGTGFNGRSVHNVFTYKSPSPQQRIHPTQKPAPLIEKLIELFSSKGDFIFDPFAGSGTTVVCADRLERNVISYENNKEYFEKASDRIKREPRLLF